MSYILVNVNYGGNWVDSVYEGGRDMDIVLTTDRIDLYNLRFQIASSCSFSADVFDICYLKRARSGRRYVSPLETDEEVVRLCTTEQYPKVYISSNNTTASSSHFPGEGAGPSSSYVPTLEQPYQQPYQHPYQQPYQYPYQQPYQYGGSFDFGNQDSDWRTNLEHIATEAPLNTARQNFIPDLNCTAEEENEGEHNVRTEVQTALITTEVVNDDDDPDYNVEEDAESSDSDRPGDNSIRRLNRALFAEFVAWIHEEGGMEKLLRLMFPGPHDNDAEEDIDTRPLQNWIVPMVPVQPLDSAVCAGDLNLIVEGLAKDAFYNTKDDLTIAVGLWNLEKNAEAKVERSDRTRLYLACKS